MTVLKPFLMLACVAFVVGFMGYLAIARLTAPVAPPADSWSQPVSEPASGAANPSKLI